jgi:hypothetical protein
MFFYYTHNLLKIKHFEFFLFRCGMLYALHNAFRKFVVDSDFCLKRTKYRFQTYVILPDYQNFTAFYYNF